MNKTAEKLLVLMAHQKAAAYHADLARDLARKLFYHEVADGLRDAASHIDAQITKTNLAYGTSVMSGLKRAR